MLDSTSSSSPPPPTQKRAASTAGLHHYTNRPAKRRASKACQCCRTRKVRCNVVDNGAPCTNCKMDDVECVITESKRRNKLDADLAKHYPIAPISSSTAKTSTHSGKKVAATKSKKVQAQQKASPAPRGSVAISPTSPSRRSFDTEKDHGQHVPHLIYQKQSRRLSLQGCNRQASINAPVRPLLPQLLARHANPPSDNPLHDTEYANQRSTHSLPSYIKPLPPRIAPEDAEYLEKRGALSVQPAKLRKELLRSYIEYVHGYLPLLDLNDFLGAIEGRSGSDRRLSLILFQAVMFAGTAFVDEVHLRNAGYSSRKATRKSFYQKVKLLYDFDYEVDRLSLVQTLLLMTYWSDTADDEKDAWHWMGIAISLSHTIGLHRNPENSAMTLKQQRLWKRIWWSCLMRDRLVALGLRRSTRIKDGDHDVPMLTLADFELEPVAEDVTCIPSDCGFARNIDLQRQMAILCIEQAGLCLCVGHVLSAQYMVVNVNIGMRSADDNHITTMMLVPRKLGLSVNEIRLCDIELAEWYEGLPNEAIYRTPNPLDPAAGNAPLFVHRALLHMIYNTTVSALHRPQIPPDSSTVEGLQGESHQKVHRAASEITAVASSLRNSDLARYLPTTGITVLLPALIIHLLAIKSPNEETRTQSTQGFAACMEVMKSLQVIYASADSALDFLEMAVCKAGVAIDLTNEHLAGDTKLEDAVNQHPGFTKIAPALTPPPDHEETDAIFVESDDVPRNLQTFLAANTPPDSEGNGLSPGTFQYHDELIDGKDVEVDFASLINLDAGASSADAGFAALSETVAG